MACLHIQSILFWQTLVVNVRLVMPLGISLIGIMPAFASLNVLRSNS